MGLSAGQKQEAGAAPQAAGDRPAPAQGLPHLPTYLHPPRKMHGRDPGSVKPGRGSDAQARAAVASCVSRGLRGPGPPSASLSRGRARSGVPGVRTWADPFMPQSGAGHVSAQRVSRRPRQVLGPTCSSPGVGTALKTHATGLWAQSEEGARPLSSPEPPAQPPERAPTETWGGTGKTSETAGTSRRSTSS